METGECRIDENDGKAPSKPQHLQNLNPSPTDGDMESGIQTTTIAAPMERGGMSTLSASATSPSSLIKRDGSFSGDRGTAHFKLIKVDNNGLSSRENLASGGASPSQTPLESNKKEAAAMISDGTVSDKDIDMKAVQAKSPGIISPAAASSSGSLDAASGAAESSAATTTDSPSSTFENLKLKYLGELEYMLREFQKLERQLLGAKTNGKNETAGSRERREKLRSFITHLEDTIQQILQGCEKEAAGEIADVENIKKTEEHILANLLPVKVRLKKQLAAQQGAKHNPVGMPTVRHGVPMTQQGKATFMREERPSQFGKPLNGESSALTQKLHGSTLGSTDRLKRTNSVNNEQPKILYAGMALGSKQIQSSVSAARVAHSMVIKNPDLLEINSELHAACNSSCTPTSTATPMEELQEWAAEETAAAVAQGNLLDADAESDDDRMLSKTAREAIMNYEEKRRLRRKKRRKRKLLREQQARAALQQPKRKKAKATKRGPRNVEYICAHCNEVYASTCDYNPWWALSQHECPKCHKVQIPRVDIGAPANAIEYHPALLAHCEENGGGTGNTAASQPPVAVTAPAADVAEQESSDLSDEDGLLSDNDLDDDDSFDVDDDDDDDSLYYTDSDVEISQLSPAEAAEKERFGLEYEGPKLSDRDTSRLLTLMMHASTCPCRHRNKEHQEVCRSTKWMMLHVRDCPGTTASFDVCPFPWCRKVKHLLYHLVSCSDPVQCPVCSGRLLTTNMALLQGLNDHRARKFHAVLQAKAEMVEEAAKAKASASKARAESARKQVAERITAPTNLEPTQPSNTTSTAITSKPITLSVCTNSSPGTEVPNSKNSPSTNETSVIVSPNGGNSQNEFSKSNAITSQTSPKPTSEPTINSSFTKIAVKSEADNACIDSTKTESGKTNEIGSSSPKDSGKPLPNKESLVDGETSENGSKNIHPPETAVSLSSVQTSITVSNEPSTLSSDIMNATTILVKSEPRDEEVVITNDHDAGIGPSSSLKQDNIPVSGSSTTEVLKVQ